MSTPGWLAGPWDLQSDLDTIERQWRPLRTILDSESLFDRRDPEVSGWSCGQHAGHCLLVARSIAEAIEGNLAQPDRNRDETTPEVATRVFETGGFPRGVAKSPAELEPEQRPRGAFLSLLPDAVAAWSRIGLGIEELADCPARDRHFALGYLTSSEWVRMCTVHTAHHLKVVRDIAGEGSIRG
jgi:hypothetical protein